MSVDFETMRARLIEQGLIDGTDLRLTPAGNARAIGIIAELQAASPPAEAERRVKWNYGAAATRAREAGRG